MKRKHWIIIIAVLSAVALGLILYFSLRPRVYKAQKLDPRTLHYSPAKHEILVGLWKCGDNEFYRFNDDGTGHTWDVSDDLTEEEASPFGWETYEEAFMITHKMRIRGIVPRYYELDCLNAFDLRFHDSYSTYSFVRVDESLATDTVNSEDLVFE